VRRRAAIILVVASAGAALAQDAGDPVDQGVEDTDPLRRSLRVLPDDLRRPTGFGRVYRVQGDPNLFMRRDGGLTAVFGQSSYQRVPGGIRADIPAGTTFFIGQTPWETAPRGSGLLPGQVDLSVPNRPPVIGSTHPEPRTMLTDELFRRRRVADLLAAARQAERDRR